MTSSKLQQYQKFELPVTLTTADLSIKYNIGCSDELIGFVKDILTKAFGSSHRLSEVTHQVSNGLGKNDKGTWLCTISPFDIDTGMNLPSEKSLSIQLKRDQLTYWITIARAQVFN